MKILGLHKYVLQYWITPEFSLLTTARWMMPSLVDGIITMTTERVALSQRIWYADGEMRSYLRDGTIARPSAVKAWRMYLGSLKVP